MGGVFGYNKGMSMKRSKQVSRYPRHREAEGPSWVSLRKVEQKTYDWQTQVAGQPESAFLVYNPAQGFKAEALIVHPKFGRGIVTRVDGKRLDVLFQDGPRKLVHAG